jgi:hypothetical protein
MRCVVEVLEQQEEERPSCGVSLAPPFKCPDLGEYTLIICSQLSTWNGGSTERTRSQAMIGVAVEEGRRLAGGVPWKRIRARGDIEGRERDCVSGGVAVV